MDSAQQIANAAPAYSFVHMVDFLIGRIKIKSQNSIKALDTTYADINLQTTADLQSVLELYDLPPESLSDDDLAKHTQQLSLRNAIYRFDVAAHELGVVGPMGDDKADVNTFKPQFGYRLAAFAISVDPTNRKAIYPTPFGKARHHATLNSQGVEADIWFGEGDSYADHEMLDWYDGPILEVRVSMVGVEKIMRGNALTGEYMDVGQNGELSRFIPLRSSQHIYTENLEFLSDKLPYPL